MGLQDFAFPFKPCLFHPDPMRWWRFPTQLVRRCRVGHPPRGIGQMRPSCARTVAQGLGMGHMEKAFPVEPCLFHPDPMRWWRSPAQLGRRCRVGHPRVAAGGGIGQMRPSCARTVAQDLGMGRMEKIFPSNPCNFLCDLSNWHQSPNLKPEWLRVDEAPRRKKKSPPQGKEAPRRGQGKKPSAGAGVWGLAPSFHSISEQSLQLIVRERRRSYHVTPQSATQG